MPARKKSSEKLKTVKPSGKRDENFFELGGHSLMMVRIQSRLRETLHVDLRIVDMFRYPTMSSLAEFLHQQPTAAVTA